jgi:hypothetical protein
MLIYFVLIVMYAVHSNHQRIRRKSQIYHRSNIVVKVIMPRTEPGNCNSTTDRNKRFFCLEIIQTFSGARTASSPMGNGVKWPRLKRGHLPPYSAEV